MALPKMKATEVGAAPQIAEPASNRTIDVMKMGLTLKIVYSFPNTSWKAQLVSRYAVPYHPMSPAELNWLVIWGMAVDMIMRSCESRTVRNIRVYSVCLQMIGHRRCQHTSDTKNMPMKMDIISSASLRPDG